MKCTSHRVSLLTLAAALLVGCSSSPGTKSADAPTDRVTPHNATLAADVQDTPSLEDLAGTSWTLRQYGLDGPKVEGATVTLNFSDGQISGSSGCNQYRGSIEAGDEPGDFQLGPIATTKRLCPGPRMTVEHTYLAALRNASRFEFHAGALLISYDDDGKDGVMLFDAEEGVDGRSED